MCRTGSKAFKRRLVHSVEEAIAAEEVGHASSAQKNIFNKTNLLAITSTIIAIFNWNSRDVSVTAWVENDN